MQLKFTQTSRFIIAEKPHGLSTHTVDPFKDGFKEFLEQKTGQELGIVSRLDSTTSGLILFPLKAFTAELNSLWQSDRCTKSYYFLTDRNPKNLESSFEVKSYIEQKSGEKSWYSDPLKVPNAVSHFTRVKSISLTDRELWLWKAQIMTGKTHQIRLHALDRGIPILGDTRYSGSPFFRLCLHAQEIQIEGETFTSANPFEMIAEKYFPFVSEFEKRSRLYTVENKECFRWLHSEVSNVMLDQYGDELFFYVYFENETKQKTVLPILNLDQAKEAAEWIAQYFKKSIYLKPMYDRGKAPGKNDLLHFNQSTQAWRDEFPPSQWLAEENSILFSLRSHQGQSPGLFLDQRENRKWVLEHSNTKHVLNLFSYTGGFSVCAAKAGAAQVTTVDLSKNFIEWSKENFALNGFVPNPEFQFWSADTLHFMKGAINKNRQWDIIICDPPTFGRSANGVFQIEKDFDLLIQSCFSCLKSNGRLLFSTNFEKWNWDDFYNKIKKAIPGYKANYMIERTPYQGLDFDLPNQIPKMKSILIKKIV